jgi:hypothetical protein
MEIVGLLLAVPVMLVVSIGFCLGAYFAFRWFPRLRLPAAILASVVLFSVMLEIGLSMAFGALAFHNCFGGFQTAMRIANMVLAAPAIAIIILVGGSRPGVRPRAVCIAAIVVCWFACMASIVGNIVVSEAVYGVDGMGVPATTPE